ncbi:MULTISPECIES: LuxR C-terminal-related transcriptional regulator [Mesorhizobium]|uniref:LuxR C-terminal-related transcriptional regulator n=1 Tax=Mesorhizobium TaxID=68287 RepID=UPI0024584131|nr:MULTISPECIES: LuxR C-terminal-related transcriptional regulator [Mesorhizobium]
MGGAAWDISQILGLSKRTVTFHLENAKAKLGVRTINQAVARMAASGHATT